MELRVGEWERSAHAEIRCVSCHEPPHKWYNVPQSLAARARLLGRDISVHLSGDYDDPVDKRLPGAGPMSNDICLQCHDANRKVTAGKRILIDHVKHAEANGSCVSCHLRTAHPVPTRGRAISFMAQCFVCHGTPEAPEASTSCGTCHPGDFNLQPESHTTEKWSTAHGRVSEVDRKQCAMCHGQNFCNNCHGLEMPHPKGWADGATGHSKIAKKSQSTCAQCHTEKPDLCSMCHHKSYDPKKGDWIKQHANEVAARGAAFCFQCHGPLYCSGCHIRGGTLE
jgi:nitrate/TMAO reductase-like tetraheme cytochrome c subunit